MGEDVLKTAQTNVGFIAHETATTDDVVDRLVTAGTDPEGVNTDGGTDERDDDSGGFVSRLLD